jgi:flagellar biosynthesis protein FlhB
MNENQRKFATTKYSEISRGRIGFYSLLVACCFGVVGLISGNIKINIIGGCLAIIFIHLLGKWFDYSQSNFNSPAMELIKALYSIILYILVFLLLLGVGGTILSKYLR